MKKKNVQNMHCWSGMVWLSFRIQSYQNQHNVSILKKTLIYFKGLQDLTNLDYIQVIIILDQRTRSMKLNKTLKNF